MDSRSFHLFLFICLCFCAHSQQSIALRFNFNDQFVADVDAGNSCFNRVAGEVGSYGSPHNFSMDYTCNYRLFKEPVPMDQPRYEWKIKRI